MTVSKQKIPLITLFVLLSIFAPALSHAQVIDKIRVIVNEQIITQGDIDRILAPAYAQYRTTYSGIELNEKISAAERSVLEGLIRDKLLLTEAKRKTIEITDQELEAKISDVRKKFSGEKEFRQALRQEKMSTKEFEKMQTERLMIEKLIDATVMPKLSISPGEVLSYYESNRAEFSEPRKVRLGSILVRIKKERSENEAMTLAQKILFRLRQGSDFGLLARQYSDGPFADSGGDMGWVEEGQLMDRINSLVFDMDDAEISGILRTKLGLHLFKVEEIKEAKTKEFEDEKERIEAIIFNKKREERLRQYIEELKENAYIAFR